MSDFDFASFGFGLYNYAADSKERVLDILKTCTPDVTISILAELSAIDWEALHQEKIEERARQNEEMLNSIRTCDLCKASFRLRDLRQYRFSFYCDKCLPIAEKPYHAVCLACDKPFVRTRAGYGQMCADCLAADANYARELRIVKSQVSRAKRAGLEASLSFQEWIGILDKYSWKCAYCGGRYEALEHIKPVFRGGGTTAQNCVPSCHACNSRKGATTSQMLSLPMFVFNAVDNA